MPTPDEATGAGESSGGGETGPASTGAGESSGGPGTDDFAVVDDEGAGDDWGGPGRRVDGRGRGGADEGRAVDPSTGNTGGEAQDDGGGCGCAAGSPAGAWRCSRGCRGGAGARGDEASRSE